MIRFLIYFAHIWLPILASSKYHRFHVKSQRTHYLHTITVTYNKINRFVNQLFKEKKIRNRTCSTGDTVTARLPLQQPGLHTNENKPFNFPSSNSSYYQKQTIYDKCIPLVTLPMSPVGAHVHTQLRII